MKRKLIILFALILFLGSVTTAAIHFIFAKDKNTPYNSERTKDLYNAISELKPEGYKYSLWENESEQRIHIILFYDYFYSNLDKHFISPMINDLLILKNSIEEYMGNDPVRYYEYYVELECCWTADENGYGCKLMDSIIFDGSKCILDNMKINRECYFEEFEGLSINVKALYIKTIFFDPEILTCFPKLEELWADSILFYSEDDVKKNVSESCKEIHINGEMWREEWLEQY